MSYKRTVNVSLLPNYIHDTCEAYNMYNRCTNLALLIIEQISLSVPPKNNQFGGCGDW